MRIPPRVRSGALCGASTLCLVGCAVNVDRADPMPGEYAGPEAPPTLGAGGSHGAAPATTGAGPYFATPMFFNDDVSGSPAAANSASIIAALTAAGGWGNSNKLQIDFSIDVLTATASTPHVAWTPNDDWYSPDCDSDPMPLPAGGDIEGNPGYACADGGDCHLLVSDPANDKLWEMYSADVEGSSFSGGCLAVWSTAKTYARALRGMQCTSADAAGYPISPLLFTADEVASGSIDHAIRFILPNDRVQQGFVPPATHATTTTGGANAPYYGVHLRLRADYPVASLPTAGARVVARAMQTYGMYHADGGNIALTAQADTHTTAKWSGLLGAKDLAALQVSDFEVIDHGASTALTGDCVRD